MHHTSPHVGSWLFLLLIPLMVWLRLRRARRAAQASDFWFEPEGDHFIYHPFGRYGAAYLVAPATRDAIRARIAVFTRVVAVVFVVVAAGPIILLSADQPLYMQWRPVIVPVRLCMILSLIAGSILWRILAVRPLYAGAPPAPRRISTHSIRAKQAAARSWWGIGISCVVLTSAACFMMFMAFAKGGAFTVYATALTILAGLNMRSLITKWQHRGVRP